MNEEDDDEEEEEEEVDDSSLFADSSSQLRSKWTRAMAAKHELVFVSFSPRDVDAVSSLQLSVVNGVCVCVCVCLPGGQQG